MNNSIMDLTVLQLALSYVFVLILLVIFKSRGIRREKEILIATTRMTVQLTAMGFILMYVFKNPSWWLTLILVFVMISAAIFNSIKRVKTVMSKQLKLIVGFSLVLGALTSAIFFIVGILGVRPWFNPQYMIPISGMIVGNSMTGISLGANKLCSDMRTDCYNAQMQHFLT